MLRRLHPDQPDGFAFTPANLAWAEAQVAKFPPGKQASAVIPLLWRVQEQEGWISRPAIEGVAAMLGMAYIRVLEVATFYFMFHLAPMGSVAHVQVCGTTSCMICGAEDLIAVCRDKIAPRPHEPSADGRMSWEEVECLGACSNAPMAQIGKDYYEDLTPERMAELIDAFARGEVPEPGPQTGRFSSEPAGGLTSLTGVERALDANASVTLARQKRDTVARIAGEAAAPEPARAAGKTPEIDQREQTRDEGDRVAPSPPAALDAARGDGPDDLTLIKGIDAGIAARLNGMGVYHMDQIAAWEPEAVAWMDGEMGGRATRDGWVEQAQQLAEVGETPYAQDKIRQE